jgi:hypothetical protein
VNYGLGTPSQDLPGFIVLPEVSYPQGGAANWSNGYLPARFQGTPLRAKGSPILDLTPPAGVTEARQRKNLDLIAKLNTAHAVQHPGHDELAARMDNYELAFRMQMQVPKVLDLSQEDASIKELYGIGQDATDSFGRKCLLARKLVEKGVRFVQLWSGADNGFPRRNWDSHEDLARDHFDMGTGMDKPAAALIKDLKARGLLEETIVLWTTEFGRMPCGQGSKGRDHNPFTFTNWLAGGGIQGGRVIGTSDAWGQEPADKPYGPEDLAATMYQCLGISPRDELITPEGRPIAIANGGRVISELV